MSHTKILNGSKIWYGSKIRKVNRCSPTVSNECSFYPALPFISSIKIFLSNVFISVNTLFECFYLLFNWEMGHPLSTYTTGGMEGDHPKCVHGKGVENLIKRNARTKWITRNKCCGSFFVHWGVGDFSVENLGLFFQN